MTAQVGQYVGNQTPEGLINFSLGQPAPHLLPIKMIGEAAGKLADADRLLLQYGATPGFEDFRTSLADFLANAHGIPVDSDQLFLSGAISLSLSLVADVFARRGGVIACEDPTYFLAKGIFDSAGIEVIGIPTDAQGLRVDALRDRIEGGTQVDLVYTIPSFQNPTGSCAPEERREALVALAEEKDFIVAADEPYNLLYFDELRPRPLAELDRGRDRVLSVSSFTKILAPGLRLGWLQGSAELLKRFASHGTLRSGGSLNPVMAYVVAEIMKSGQLARHLEMLRDQLGRRRDALCEALREELPDLRFELPAGGYFVWAHLPEGESSRILNRAAKSHGVAFTPGYRCAVDGEFDNSLRLSFAFYDPGELREGVRRIAAARRAAVD
jgi:DNA-binding transcriptional MocR family regulator